MSQAEDKLVALPRKTEGGREDISMRTLKKIATKSILLTWMFGILIALAGCGGGDDDGYDGHHHGNHDGSDQSSPSSTTTTTAPPTTTTTTTTQSAPTTYSAPTVSNPKVTVVNNSSYTDAFTINSASHSLTSLNHGTWPYSGSLSFTFDTLAGYSAPLPANGDDGQDITVTINNGTVPGTVTASLNSNARFEKELGL